MISLLISAVVVLAVSDPDTVIVCAAALVIVPLDALDSVTPVAGDTLQATPTWLAGTVMVKLVNDVLAAGWVCPADEISQVATP